MIKIPNGKLLSHDDTSAAQKRKKLRDTLLKGNTVIVNTGEVKAQNETKPQEINQVIPEGKLAYYWYENNEPLLDAEMEAMNTHYPQFKLSKNNDGRLYWIGELNNITGENSKWHLQVIYDNDHPNNNSYGGSVKIYPIKPVLEDMQEQIGESIPHILSDSDGYLYICTARKEDIRIGATTTTAASSLAWAAKWIAAFELWLAGGLDN
ncbi:MAG: hypothetical protein U9Q30_08685 [Campylobacterota bacterium]|nr:hypothetical protein [Campylobacterota bacterium]